LGVLSGQGRIAAALRGSKDWCPVPR
jgi:hypothetical protein